MSTADGILDQIDSTLGDYAVSGDAMRWAPDAAGGRPEALPRTVVITIDTTRINEAFAYFREIREHLHTWAEAARPQLEEAGRSLAKVGETAQQAAACDVHCKPARPRDRPAWQSPYGPARRRR